MDITTLFEGITRDFGALDTVVHSVAYATPDDLKNEFLQTARDGFRIAHDVSAYSLVAVTRAAVPLLEKSGQGSVLAMTYYGSEKVAAGYNVMGVAKASLEASVRYLAACAGLLMLAALPVVTFLMVPARTVAVATADSAKTATSAVPARRARASPGRRGGSKAASADRAGPS